ncbi:MAG: hypothetical protein ACP5VE_09920 [Chthonomonadales bacterium]
MSFDVRLGNGTPRERAAVEEYLLSLPDMQRSGDKLLYVDPEEDVTTEIRVLGGDRAEGLDVLVPITVSTAAAERIAALCMGLAEKFQWTVKDAAGSSAFTHDELVRRFSGASPLTARTGCLSGLMLVMATALILRLQNC